MAGRSRGIMADGFDPREEFLYESGRSVPRNVVRVKIHREVTFIPDGLFENCYYLESVTFHAGLEGMGERAFEGCSSLRAFRCPPSARKIGAGAFAWCSRLTEIDLAEGLEEIEHMTFFCCTSLQEVRIPPTVTKISANAFTGCSSLGLAEFAEGLRKIGDDAFQGCLSLGSVLIPRTVESIGWRAFGGCENLTSVHLHEDLEEIDEDAFLNCPLANVRFARLSERREAIRMDAQAESMFDIKLNEITGAMTKWNFKWVECKESLRQAHTVLDHWEELNEAATTLELAQWKSKIQEEEGEGRADFIDDNPGRRILGVEMRVTGGASIVTKEALKFLTHSETWE